MKTTQVLEKEIQHLQKLKKTLTSDNKKNVGKDPLRGILIGVDIPDSLVDEAIKEFNQVK